MSALSTNNFVFIHPEHKNSDYFLCTCGHQFSHATSSTQEDEFVIDIGLQNHNSNAQDDVLNLVKKASLKTKTKVVCPKCNLNFHDSSLKNRIFFTEEKCLGVFNLESSKDFFKLEYKLYMPYFLEDKIKITEVYKYIQIDRVLNQITYKGFDDPEVLVDLDNLVFCVKNFFDTENPKVIENLLSVHFAIDELCRFVIDSKNINIFQGLLENIRNRHNYAGFEHIEKIFIIFLGIIKYSNLSTIALTKGAPFLYEVMTNCNMPKSSVLMENKLTAPVKIFNFLANTYTRKLSSDIQESREASFLKSGFSWKGKAVKIMDSGLGIDTDKGELQFEVGPETEAEYLINPNAINYDGGKVKNDGSGYKVYDEIISADISKSIYNTIKKFSDYKQLIKFMKLVDKNQLINLISKFPLELLVNSIDHIYFRHFSNKAEIERVLMIMDDYAKCSTPHYHADANLANELGLGVLYTDKPDYKTLFSFSFVIYDDSKMMLDVLKFDTKRHFNKIKTWQELSDYHDNLVKFCRSITEEERSGSIKSFTHKFSFLEERVNYQGPLSVKILDTPALIIREGVEMKHSASSYSSIVAQGTYLICSVYDNDINRPEEEFDRFTMGFWYNKVSGLEFHQVKSYGNELGSDRFKKLVMEYLTCMDIPFRPVKDLRLDEEV